MANLLNRDTFLGSKQMPMPAGPSGSLAPLDMAKAAEATPVSKLNKGIGNLEEIASTLDRFVGLFERGSRAYEAFTKRKYEVDSENVVRSQRQPERQNITPVFGRDYGTEVVLVSSKTAEMPQPYAEKKNVETPQEADYEMKPKTPAVPKITPKKAYELIEGFLKEVSVSKPEMTAAEMLAQMSKNRAILEFMLQEKLDQVYHELQTGA